NAEEYRDSLQNIEREAEHLTALSDSLLSLARADSECFDMPLARTDLNQAAASVVELYRTLAMEKRIRLQGQMAAAPALANANESGVRRLLMILVDNALQYTPPGGSVTVSVQSMRD